METQLEKALRIIEESIKTDLTNGDCFQNGEGHYKTKNGLTVATVSDGNLILLYSFKAPRLVAKMDKEADLKQAGIYEEKARELRAKWVKPIK